MTVTVRHVDKIAKVLRQNKGKNVSAARLASLTKIPRDSVHKRIHDLVQSGLRVTKTYDVIKGQRRVFYRAA